MSEFESVEKVIIPINERYQGERLPLYKAGNDAYLTSTINYIPAEGSPDMYVRPNMTVRMEKRPSGSWAAPSRWQEPYIHLYTPARRVSVAEAAQLIEALQWAINEAERFQKLVKEGQA